MYQFEPTKRNRIAQLINSLEDRVNQLKTLMDHAYSLTAYNNYKYQLHNELNQLQTIKNYYNETV